MNLNSFSFLRKEDKYCFDCTLTVVKNQNTQYFIQPHILGITLHLPGLVTGIDDELLRHL
jgi:hypothetical protein